MGRFIGIGILYQVDLWRHAPKEELVKFCSEDLFDYSLYDDTSSVRLRADITSERLADLRIKVMDFCKLPEESHKDNSTGWKRVSFEKELDGIIRQMSLDQLIELAGKKEYYTFQECEQLRLLDIGENGVRAAYHFFLIFISAMKFYPSKGYATHEITQKVERLIHIGVDEKELINLVKCFVTQ